MAGCSLANMETFEGRDFCLVVVASDGREIALSAANKNELMEWRRAFLSVFKFSVDQLLTTVSVRRVCELCVMFGVTRCQRKRVVRC